MFTAHATDLDLCAWT